ncbi:MAG TPA: thioredoxin domain-containing protein [Microbacterium sp.]|uniref:DsbA family protein n=1 Tax=Microbacterium sp. TaxID=51671 RepID=UPI002B476F7A|nr:thioredoxin domain-containing protein [Microbacterium sp.]HKT58020.1 thioredoxin domain-containing protein [Microbacterium sp.]
MAERRGSGFAIWITAVVALVVAVVIGVVIAVDSAAKSTSTDVGARPSGSIINTKTGAISVGDPSAKNTVATYIDFMCPVCNAFEKHYGPTLRDQVERKTVHLQVHPVAILDRASNGTQFSSRAASAAYCVAQDSPDSVWPFITAMYADQPKEGSDGLADARIVAIAHGAGATASGLDACITSHRFVGYVQKLTESLPADPATGQAGTPTVIVNGTYIPYAKLAAGDPQAILAKLK